MKRLLSLILALAMMFSLAACGSSSSSSGDNSSNDSSASTEGDTTDVGDVANDPAVTLTVTSAFTATQLQGIFLTYLKEQVEEKSGGSITLELYLGGTLCGADEELTMLSDGSVDLIMLYIAANAFNLPVFAPFMYYTGSMEETYDAVYEVCYENEDSVAELTSALETYNATLLPGFVVSSQQVWVSRTEVSTWADMYTGKLGCPTDSNYSNMGYQNLVTATDSDYYESMRTGLIDSFSSTAADIVTNMYYEVADYFMTTDTYRVGDWVLINSDTLAGMTDAQRAVLEECCEDMSEYAISYQQELAEQMTGIVEENGGTILSMTQDEVDWYMYCSDILGWESMISTLGEATGTTDALTVIIEATKEAMVTHTDYDLEALEAKYAE